MVRTVGTDPGETKLLEDVEKFGWHCLNILAEGELPPYSFSVGLFHSYQHPELIIFGLPANVAHQILHIAAEAIKGGNPIDLALPTEELLEGYSCCFVEVQRLRLDRDREASRDLNRLLNKPGQFLWKQLFVASPETGPEIRQVCRAVPNLAPGPEESGSFLARPGDFPRFAAERGRGAGGRAVLPGGLIYTTVSVAAAVSRRRAPEGTMRRRITCIGLPQQGQRNAGRGFSVGGTLGGVMRSTRCSSAIRLFLFGCRKP